MIEAGELRVHLEDQSSSAKSADISAGKVLVPTTEAVQKLIAARLAADVLDVPTLVLARTDANSAHLLTSDECIILRSHSLPAPVSALGRLLRPSMAVWTRPSPAAGVRAVCRPDLVRDFRAEPEGSRALRRRDPRQVSGQVLAYNCSPSFNWKKKLDDATIARFQPALAEMGYKFQFITLAGFHALNLGMFELARAYKDRA